MIFNIKVAIVAPGSRGTGRSIALKLADKRAKVVVASGSTVVRQPGYQAVRLSTFPKKSGYYLGPTALLRDSTRSLVDEKRERWRYRQKKRVVIGY